MVSMGSLNELKPDGQKEAGRGVGSLASQSFTWETATELISNVSTTVVTMKASIQQRKCPGKATGSGTADVVITSYIPEVGLLRSSLDGRCFADRSCHPHNPKLWMRSRCTCD